MKKLVSIDPFNCPEAGSTYIQGIRGIEGTENVYIAGSLTQSTITEATGLLYAGPLKANGTAGTWYSLNYRSPDVDDVTCTSCYGPNGKSNGEVQVVGAYIRESKGGSNLGFLYEGPPDGSGRWTTLHPNHGNYMNCFVHSIMGQLAVGNYDTELDNGYAFIYDLSGGSYQTFKAPGAYSTTLYGIWHNGGTRYTLAGGCSSSERQDASQAFIVDWDSATRTASNWAFYQYLDQDAANLVTHFEGVTGDNAGGYNLAADFASVGKGMGSAFAHIGRNGDGTFGEAEWVSIESPTSDITPTSANTSFENKILGIYKDSDGAVNSYVAEVI